MLKGPSRALRSSRDCDRFARVIHATFRSDATTIGYAVSKAGTIGKLRPINLEAGLAKNIVWWEKIHLNDDLCAPTIGRLSMSILREMIRKSVFAALAATVVISPTWAEPKTSALAGNHPPEAVSLHRSASPSMLLRIRIIFALRNRNGLDTLLSELQDSGSARHRRWLTSAEFQAHFGQPAAEIEKVREWMSDHGFPILSFNANEIGNAS